MVILSGGARGGMEVEDIDWAIGEIREFPVSDGVLEYRNDEGDHAVYVGVKVE